MIRKLFSRRTPTQPVDAWQDAEVQKLHKLGYDKLNLGCGRNPLAGWTNIDGGDGKRYGAPEDDVVVKLDIFSALAEIPSDSVGYITSEQFFEHFDRHEGHRLLGEWCRVLRPGGVVRILTPDLEKEVLIYLNKLEGLDWDATVLPHRYRHIRETSDPYGKLIEGEKYMPSMLLNNGMHMDGHKYLYDFETIKHSMELAGLTQVTRVAYGESEHDALRGIDKHDGGDTGRSWIPGIVLGVEGTKP